LNPSLTNQLITNWNATLTIIAQLMDIPVVLVMSVEDSKIKVFAKNAGSINPYTLGDSETLQDSGLYCERVIKTQKPLEVVNALQDPTWCNNPDLALDMIYYYGVPLNSEHQETFGTLCVLDTKQRKIEPKFVSLLNEVKATFEMQLSLFNNQQQMLEQKSISNIDSLVWGMAHHLNTPIGTSITSLSIIKERIKIIEDNITSQKLTMKLLTSQITDINDSLMIAESSMKKAALLVDDYRDISIEQNQDSVTKFKIRKFLIQCVKTKECQSNVLGIDVAIQCDNNLYICTCQNLLSQVFMHLMNNTLVHAFDKKIEHKQININVSLKKSFIELTYMDNGCGIQSDIQSDIFKPFFTTDMSKGHGLGLSIVEKIISLQLHGKITLTNSAIGTSYKIQLPK